MAFSENSVIKISELRDAIYPVGSIYLSINNTNPKTFFGGEWELLPEGYALWTCSSNGGSTISAGLPNIKGFVRHSTNACDSYNAGALSTSKGTVYGNSGTFLNATYGIINFDASSGQVDTSGNYVTDSSKIVYGKSDTVQPPAYKVYAWKRIPEE